MVGDGVGGDSSGCVVGDGVGGDSSGCVVGDGVGGDFHYLTNRALCTSDERSCVHKGRSSSSTSTRYVLVNITVLHAAHTYMYICINLHYIYM